MSTKENDELLELLADYHEGNIIDDEEWDKSKNDPELAYELIQRYAKDYDTWCQEGELTRKSDEQDYQSSINPL